MDVDRDTVVEAVAAIVPPTVAIAAIYVVGQTYASPDGISPQGAQAVVVVITAFVLMTTVVGLWRARTA